MIIQEPVLLFSKETGEFPNSPLPVVVYRHATHLPILFKARYLKRMFARNRWTNAWNSGIFTHHHYHSTTHEVLGFFKGGTTLQIGGPNGKRVVMMPGDIVIIPAGVAHKNLGKEYQVGCIGAYPDGRNFDINTGEPSERPKTDHTIAAVP
jgi:uncharacterized protein YjlB